MVLEEERTCKTCGRMLVETSWGGGCAFCLLQLGLTKSSFADSTSLQLATQTNSTHNSIEGCNAEILTRFGDYELISEIARGGMGVVYRARQLSLDRQVAVKLILAGQLATKESLDRFRLEAQSAARLRHPGIVQIYEIGEYETQYFYSMELIHGESLSDCLEEFRLDANASAVARRLQEDCIAQLMAKIARALDFAHRHGVLHRDLKPSNILIDEEGEPHLTDFGLAKLLGNEDNDLSLSNAVLGTPGYVAPEQVAGSKDITIAADVYGLGATLYELLAGRPPFTGSSAMATMLQAIQSDAKPVRSINPNVNRDLDTISLHCLERDPQRRYKSAGEVADELERYLRREPIRARSISWTENVRRWCARNPRTAILAFCLLATLFIGVTTVLWQWTRAENANKQLANSVERLRWDSINDMLRTGQTQRALAGVAAMLRRDAGNWKAAMFGMSVMEQHNFPVPFAAEIQLPSELTIARISPQGDYVATASQDGVVRLWKSKSSEPILPVLRHDSPVTHAEFSSDGQHLATSSVGGQVRVWRVPDGELVEPIIHVPSEVERVRYSTNGRMMLVKSNNSVQIHDSNTKKKILGPLQSSGRIADALFVGQQPDKSMLFLAIQDGSKSRLQLWNIDEESLLWELHVGPLIHAAISPDLTVAATIDHHRLAIWDIGTRSKRKEIETQRRFSSVAFNRTGTELLVSGFNDWAQIWSIDSAQPITPELTHYYIMNGATFLGNGDRILTWGDDSLAQIWSADSGKRFIEPMLHPNRVQFAEAGKTENTEVYLASLSHGKSPKSSTVPGAVQLWHVHYKRKPADRSKGFESMGYDGAAISPDGKWLALAKTTQEIWVMETSTGKTVCGPLKIDGGCWGLRFDKDQTKLISTTSSGQVTLWSVPDGKLIHTPTHLHVTIQPLELANNGKLFGTGSVDGYVRVWDMSTGQILSEMKHGSEINSIAFSPDSELIASAGEDHLVHVWDARTGKRFATLKGHSNEVMRVRFIEDRKRIVTASLDRTARVWDAEKNQMLFRMPHNGEVIDVDVSRDGKWIATASRDRTAMIWDAKSGVPHARSLFHEQGVRNVIFSPDGKSLLTRDFRGLRLWDVSLGTPLTVHLEHLSYAGSGFQSSSVTAQFTPDGEQVFVAPDSPDALLWQMPRAHGIAPIWLADFFEAVAGQRFIEGDEMVAPVPTSEFLELREEILNSSGTDVYSEWARSWLSSEGP